MFGRQTGFVAMVVVLAACAADKPEPTGIEVRVPLFAVGGHTGGNGNDNLGTHLTGDEEVFTPTPPSTATPADSRAQGQAIFRVNSDGTVDFRLIASNIDNVFMAHIHCALRRANGPIRMWLYPEQFIGPGGPPPGTVLPTGTGPQNGVLASGTFNLKSGTPPTDITCPNGTSLLAAMRSGLTYVNVHTNDGVAPANTGPGDFPGGEIRGQLGDKNN